MERTLIVSATHSGAQFVRDLLPAAEYAPVTVASSGGEARRLLAASDFGLVVVNTPLGDEFGHELACLAARGTAAGVMMLVKSERADDVTARVEDEGIFVVPKPTTRSFFFQALKLVAAARRRTLGLHSENRKLQTAIEEIRLIDRAKCALIQCLLMTEPQAHRYIEKQAMDLRVSKREVAETILKTYEL